MSQETKKCPYCGEEILAVAKKCKHCGTWLDGRDEAQASAPVIPKQNTPVNTPVNKSTKKPIDFLNIAIGILAVGAIASASVYFTTDQKVLHTQFEQDSIQAEKVLSSEPNLNTDENKFLYSAAVASRENFEEWKNTMGIPNTKDFQIGVYSATTNQDPKYRAYYAGISLACSSLLPMPSKIAEGEGVEIDADAFYAGFSHAAIGKAKMTKEQALNTVNQ